MYGTMIPDHIHYNSNPLQHDVSTVTVYTSGVGDNPVIDSNQLTLSFRCQVYVFDSVAPDKVQAALVLLGGCELLSSVSQCAEISIPTSNQRGAMEYTGRCSHPQRAASLNRFRQKRKDRCFDKKVRYSVRQEVALRMNRNKGQFTSSKKQDADESCGADQESEQDAGRLETSCTHCGVSSKSTPMMRRGPSGPRSLCNACGLFWANRGTLRDISKRKQEHSLVPPEQVDEGNDLDGPTAIPAHDNLVTFTDMIDTALVSDR